MNKQSSGCKGPNTVVHNNNNKEKLKAQDKHGNKVPGVVHASNLVVVVDGEQPTGGQSVKSLKRKQVPQSGKFDNRPE